MKKIVMTASIFLFSISVFSAPREIVLIRHADKWKQSKPGPYLSPKGQLRAELFAQYYLKNYQKPDYIFASKPHGSMRPLLTVIPLANELAYNNPNGYTVDTQYSKNKYSKLTQALLHDTKYQNKLILIAWQHEKINAMVESLGVTQKLEKWHGSNYDMVYVLKYDATGKLTAFKILKDQYPVKKEPTWSELAK